MHHHLVEEAGYIDCLLNVMDEYEIEKTALIGLGPLFKGLFVKHAHDGSCADDEAVEKMVKLHPDRFFGLGYIRLGVDTAAKVDELYERGFSGLKFHIPQMRYDDERAFEIYQKALEYDLPCLFHTGVVCLPEPQPLEQISSSNMSCIHLEAVAQRFPRLKIIIAHLGIQDYMTALTLIRIFDNIYADLSGSTPGWRANLSMSDWQRFLWFPNADRKILYGSDVHYSEIKASIDFHQDVTVAANWTNIQQENIYFNNSKSLFKGIV